MTLQIVRKKLTADEIQPAGTRWNADCNCVQQSPDGGVTWNDAPGLDPRTNPGGLLPPLISDDPQCDAATAMAAFVKSAIDKFLEASNLLQAANLIFAAIALVLPVAGLIVDAVFLLVEALLTIGSSEIVAAMTPEVYETLTNIFYCNLNAEGQMSADGFARCYTDIEAQLTDPVVGICERVLDLIGFVTLDNAGAMATEAGDCSGFACAWCYSWNFAMSDGGWLVGAQGTWSGSAWLSENIAPAVYDILIYTECGGGCGLPAQTITLDAEWFSGTGIVPPVINVFDRDGGGGYTPMTPGQTMTSGRAIYVFDVSAYGNFNALAVNLVSSDDTGGSVALYSAKAEGTGSAPEFIGGEDCS